MLDFLCNFDWISPLAADIRDLLEGPNHTYFIPEDCGWSLNEVANLLHQNGVETWGHMIVNHDIMITVREPQAHWGQYLIQREGIPLRNVI